MDAATVFASPHTPPSEDGCAANGAKNHVDANYTVSPVEVFRMRRIGREKTLDPSAEVGPSSAGIARGATWLVLAGQAERVLGIVSIAILARYLTPADFGLMGTAGAAAAIIEVLGAFGFDWALIRVRNPTKHHLDTAWTLRLLFGIAVGMLMCAVAVPASSFYNSPEVAFLLYGIAANGVIGALENIGTIEYRRKMDFSLEFKSRIISKLVGAVLAVSVAVVFRSYWALLVGITASRLASVSYSYFACAFRPSFSLQRTGDLFAFSGWLLVSSLVTTGAARFSNLYIGFKFGPTSVGQYGMATELATLATNEIAAPVNRVMFSKYSEHGGDISMIGTGFKRVSGAIWLLGFPACLGIIATAPDIVRILLGGQWGTAVPILQVLALANLIDVMAANTHYVYWGIGRAKFVAILDVIKSVVLIGLSPLLGTSLGLLGLALAKGISASLALIINYTTLSTTLSISIVDLLKGQWRTVAASAWMALVLYGLIHGGVGGSWPIYFHLAASIFTGFCVYTTCIYLLWLMQGQPEGAEMEVAKVFFTIARDTE